MRARLRAVAMVVAVAITACTSTTANDEDPTPTPTPTRARTVDPGRLADALARAERATYKVTYALNGRIASQAIAGRWITYQRPPFIRVDALLASGSASEGATTFIAGEVVVVCALGPEPPCEYMSRGDAEALGFFTQPLDAPFRAEPRTFDLARTFEERIAGTAVTCFVVEPKPASRTPYLGFEACYTADGIPLRIRMELQEGQIELEAEILLRDFPAIEVIPP